MTDERPADDVPEPDVRNAEVPLQADDPIQTDDNTEVPEDDPATTPEPVTEGD